MDPAASIEAFVRANVKPGTTLLTDGHRSYPGLTDYRHDPRTVGKMAGHVVLKYRCLQSRVLSSPEISS
jgi:hypothetical protein